MRILIIHTAFIGDIVLSTPLIKVIWEKYKEAEIDYLTLPGNKPVLVNNPYLRDIILYDKKGRDKGITGFLRTMKEIKRRRYDMAVIPHRFIRSIALARLAGIRKVIGFDVATGSFLLTEKVHYDMGRHEVERLLELVSYKGEKVPIGIFPSEENKERISRLLSGKKYRNLITVAPGSQRPEKIWPIEKYNELIGKLASDEGNLIAVTGGKAEKGLPVTVDKENIMDLRGEINLLEFAALLSASDIVISNDSSPVHMASAFPKPFIIGIFGPGKRQLGFFPWSERSVVIEDNDFYENSITVIPESQHKYSKDYYKGIPEISVERVYGEVVRRLEEKNGK